MSTRYTNIFTDEDILFILNLPEVISSKNSLTDLHSKVYFTITLTESIKNSIYEKLGLDLFSYDFIPMRWIKGDTLPHIDHGAHEFENTYLIYLNDSPGEIRLDEKTYPILRNTGFVFKEGLYHETLHTENIPRLLIGPMNEFAEPVGASTTFYYPSETDALSGANLIAQYDSYIIFAEGGFTHWRIASNSEGSSSQSVVYTVGDVLNGPRPVRYYLYPTAPCFLEGTKILCLINGKEEYVSVENLEKGVLVKTSLDGYKKVEIISHGIIENTDTNERIENRLYKLSKEKYPELTDDLFITGCHSILVTKLSEIEREKTKKILGNIFVTDKKYRLMACVDERSEPWQSKGSFNIWHFALENQKNTNYGVYANGKLLVETSFIDFLKSSNLKSK